MKSFFSLLFIALIFGCSDGSDLGSDTSFDSQIMIDDTRFEPTRNTSVVNNIFTSYQENQQQGFKRRTFNLIKASTNIQAVEAMQIMITYPFDQQSVNGTYSFDPIDFTLNNSAEGYYSMGATSFLFYTGTITVTDLGNDEYKLEFNSVTAAESTGGPTEKSITGFAEGRFAVNN